MDKSLLILQVLFDQTSCKSLFFTTLPAPYPITGYGGWSTYARAMRFMNDE